MTCIRDIPERKDHREIKEKQKAKRWGKLEQKENEDGALSADEAEFKTMKHLIGTRPLYVN